MRDHFFWVIYNLLERGTAQDWQRKSIQTHDNGGSYELIMVQQLIVLWVRR